MSALIYMHLRSKLSPKGATKKGCTVVDCFSPPETGGNGVLARPFFFSFLSSPFQEVERHGMTALHVCACGSDVDYRIKKVTNHPFIPGGFLLRRELLGIRDPSTERGYQCT